MIALEHSRPRRPVDGVIAVQLRRLAAECGWVVTADATGRRLRCTRPDGPGHIWVEFGFRGGISYAQRDAAEPLVITEQAPATLAEWLLDAPG